MPCEIKDLDAMMAKGKRAPGGGRKRLGPSVARNLTIRIDDELRERLEVEVGKRAQRRRNWNLSQEILMRLNQSLSREQERSHDPATRALTFLISDVVKLIDLGLPIKWHQNPFMFRAFKLAVGMVLDTIEPSGEMQSPYEVLRKNPEDKWFFDQYRTPEIAASLVANVVMRKFFRPSMVRDYMKSEEPNNYSGPTADEIDREFYSFSDAKRALGIDKPKETKS
jgi:hypothetical protein